MDRMEQKRLISHAEAARRMRRVGYSREQIEEVLREVPDPIDMDSELNIDTFFKHGISYERVMDRMGGSP
jgi:hypothetical protein